MRFEVCEKIHTIDATPQLMEWCREHLVLDNPEYIKKQRMGLWTGNIPKQIALYEKQGRNILIPFGCIDSLRQTFPDISCYSRIAHWSRFKYYSGIKLYDYQKNALIAALRAKNGVLVMPCGAGKTQTALSIIAALGGRALWLTHTQDLLNQSLNRAKSVFNNIASAYGTITNGKVDIGPGITFATIQTMNKIDLTQYRDVWDVVIVDECHKAIGAPTKVMQFYKVLSNLSCRYKFGVTATPKRSDGLEKSMFALLGDIIHVVGKNEVAGTTCPVNVQLVQTKYMPNLQIALSGDGTINYAGLVNDMITNEARFALVLRTISELPKEDPVLVLGNRVEYLRKLCECYRRKSVCLSAMGHSKSAKDERKKALSDLNEGRINCIFATYQLAKEGLDIPNLRYVVFATPEKDETTVMQAAGRVGRKADGKSYGTVIDFQDDFGMYNGWAKKRKNYYKKLGYNVLT